MKTPLTIVRSRRLKHAACIFIKSGDTFVAKAYGHDGADAEATAKLILDRVNGWDALFARATAAENALDDLRDEVRERGRDMDLLT